MGSSIGEKKYPIRVSNRHWEDPDHHHLTVGSYQANQVPEAQQEDPILHKDHSVDEPSHQ